MNIERLARQVFGEDNERTMRLSQSTLDAVRDAIIWADPDGAVCYANQAACRCLGYSRDEFLSLHVWEYDPGMTADSWPAAWRRIRNQRSGLVVESSHRSRDGRLFPVEISWSAIEFGDQVHACGIIRDITDRKRAETQLQIRDRQQQCIARFGQRALQGTSLAELFDEAARAVSQFLEVEYAGVFEFTMTQPGMALRAGAGWSTGAGIALEPPCLDADSLLARDFGSQPLLERHGVVSSVGAIIQGQDRPFGILSAHATTRRTFAADQLHFVQAIANVLAATIENRREREEISKFFDLCSEMLAIAGPDGCFKRVNPAWERNLGLSRQELLSKPFLNFVHPDDRSATLAVMGRMAAGNAVRDFENRYVTKDGGYRWLLWNAAPVSGDGRAYAVAMDITGRKETEQALRQSEERFRRAILDAPFPIMIHAGDGEVLQVNRTWTELTGYTAEELPTVKAWAAKAFGQEADAALRDLADLYCSGESTAEREHLVRLADGGERTWICRSVALGRLSDGRCHFISAALDVTERRRLEEQLRQAQKMEAIGQLAGGVAHDFNNLLTVIIGHNQLLMGRIAEADPLRLSVHEIDRAAERAASLTRQLLAFSRRQMLRPTVLSLNSVVSGVENMLRRLIGEQIELVTALDPDLGLTRVDAGQTEQVILNLAVNARDAMPNGGQLAIVTKNARITDEDPQKSNLEPGDYVLLAVTDNGVGMTDEVRKRIFEPFFTTKETGKGTGLGLSTAFGIVKQSGGDIRVHSEPGRGATFKIYFRRVYEAGSPAGKPAANAAVAGRNETILLVEDDQAIRFLSAEILQAAGYQVLEARNGGEALRICERSETPIDLVLTDVVMPGMNGRELMSRLGIARPGIRALYMSGYAENTIVMNGMLEEGTEFIQKPFTPAALALRIRECLAAARGKSILVVDDDQAVRRVLTAALAQAGYDVSQAPDGRAALRHLEMVRTDLLITDLVMPEAEGLELIRKARVARRDLKVIAVSGAFGGRFLKVAELLGASASLEKPLRAEQLLATVRSVLDGAIAPEGSEGGEQADPVEARRG